MGVYIDQIIYTVVTLYSSYGYCGYGYDYGYSRREGVRAYSLAPRLSGSCSRDI